MSDLDIGLVGHLFFFLASIALAFNGFLMVGKLYDICLFNLATGKIKGLTFETSEDFVSSTEDYNLIIVDDICSYGGTFDLAITEISKKYKFKAAYLVVSHLEEVYTKGKLVNNPLLKGIYHENTMDWSIDKPNYIEVNNERN